MVRQEVEYMLARQLVEYKLVIHIITTVRHIVVRHITTTVERITIAERIATIRVRHTIATGNSIIDIVIEEDMTIHQKNIPITAVHIPVYVPIPQQHTLFLIKFDRLTYSYK